MAFLPDIDLPCADVGGVVGSKGGLLSGLGSKAMTRVSLTICKSLGVPSALIGRRTVKANTPTERQAGRDQASLASSGVWRLCRRI